MENSVLVSIPVISYNSGKTIIETLDSIKNQTYQNLELIISDDCSLDNTIGIVKQWIEVNKQRFKNVLLLTSETNNGVAKNLNRAISACSGVWIKSIAGDDMLMPDCIQKDMTFALKNPDLPLFFTDYNYLYVDGEQKRIENSNLDKDFFNLNAHEQFLYLINKNAPAAPTKFANAQFMKEHLYDERYPFLEDRPMWCRLTKAGLKMHLYDEVTVLWRRGESLTSSHEYYYNTRYMESAKAFFVNERARYLLDNGFAEKHKAELKKFKLYDYTIKFGLNKITPLHHVLYRLLILLIYHH